VLDWAHSVYSGIFAIRHLVQQGAVSLFLVFLAYVWALWSLKASMASMYQPYTDPDGLTKDLTTSVIVPVYDEPEETFRAVLTAVRRNNPTEVIVAVDGGSASIATVAAEYGAHVLRIAKTGKRGAIAAGFAVAANTDIVVVLDSDTVWSDGMLPELLKPFADPRVGGVTPTQRIMSPDLNPVRRLADWIEDLRYSLTVRAQSIFGQVGCLPGRTIAYRRSAFEDAVQALTGQKVLGVPMKIGDDRVLTGELLRAGWRTVYQSTALVLTEAPDTWVRFWRQQLRWARSSQRETVLSLGWILRKPVAALVFFSDIVTTLMLFALVNLIITHVVQHDGDRYMPDIPVLLAVSLTLIGLLASVGLRQIGHFRRKPSDIPRLPMFVAQMMFVMVPTKIAAMATMFHNGWGTRASEDIYPEMFDTTPVPAVRVRQIALNAISLSLTICLLMAIAFAVNATAATQPRQLGIIGTSAQFASAKSLHPSIRGDYVPFGGDFAESLVLDQHLNATAYITWTAVPGITLAQIAAGDEDAYLRREADAVRTYGGMVYIRLAQEFNGNWFSWSGDPKAFVAAWREVWTVFHDAGATNVRWVWGPDLLTNDNAKQYAAATTPYWPGSKYVNAVGPTMVEFAAESNCEVACRMSRIDWIHKTYGKPVWLAETKVDLAEAKPWLTSLDAALVRRPWITAVAWSETPSRGEALGQAGTGEMDWQLPGYPRLESLLAKAQR
jgi:hyaluronan synthase